MPPAGHLRSIAAVMFDEKLEKRGAEQLLYCRAIFPRWSAWSRAHRSSTPKPSKVQAEKVPQTQYRQPGTVSLFSAAAQTTPAELAEFAK